MGCIVKIFKTVLASVLLAALCLGLFVVFQGKEYCVSAASSFRSGEYVLVVSGITPTGMTQGDYAMTGDTAVHPGMLFSRFYVASPESAFCWKVTKVSDTECTIQNPARGENGYLNMSANTLTYGKKQNLKYQWVSGKCKFYVTVGGTNYYIRFTNSTNNESRFHAGTGDGSNLFLMYEKIELPTSTDADLPLPSGKPLLSLACISDCHVDYGLQSRPPYMRSSVIKTLETISREENADLLLVGGDNTSDNGRVADKGGWTYATYQNVINAYRSVAAGATSSGRSLWACGNHDYQAGEFEGYDSYAGFVDIMTETCGTPLSIYYQRNDTTLTDQRRPEHVMGLHYNVAGFDFIILNAPYAKSDTYSSGTLQWFSGRMKSIGAGKTVFLLTHYPLGDSRGISQSAYGVKGGVYNTFTSILKQYPNVIYLYGHNHGDRDVPAYITTDTFQRITSYTPSGTVIHSRNVVPSSFISSFMGSMGYYPPTGLTAADPEIIQALMIYVYNDRIVFQMKNYGSVFSQTSRTLKSWTVMRNVSGDGENTGTDSSQKPSTTDTPKPNGTVPSKPNSSTVSSSGSSGSSRPNSSTSRPNSSSGASKPNSSSAPLWSSTDDFISTDEGGIPDGNSSEHPTDGISGESFGTSESEGGTQNETTDGSDADRVSSATDKKTDSQNSGKEKTDKTTDPVLNQTDSHTASSGVLIWVAVCLGGVAVLSAGGLALWYFFVYKKP